jgi:hypothetical protein
VLLIPSSRSHSSSRITPRPYLPSMLARRSNGPLRTLGLDYLGCTRDTQPRPRLPRGIPDAIYSGSTARITAVVTNDSAPHKSDRQVACYALESTATSMMLEFI